MLTLEETGIAHNWLCRCAPSGYSFLYHFSSLPNGAENHIALPVRGSLSSWRRKQPKKTAEFVIHGTTAAPPARNLAHHAVCQEKHRARLTSRARPSARKPDEFDALPHPQTHLPEHLSLLFLRREPKSPGAVRKPMHRVFISPVALAQILRRNSAYASAAILARFDFGRAFAATAVNSK